MFVTFFLVLAALIGVMLRVGGPFDADSAPVLTAHAARPPADAN